MKKTILLLFLLIPSLAFGWTFTASMDSYPSIGGGYSCTNTYPSYGESVAMSGSPDGGNVLRGHYAEGTAGSREPFKCTKTLPSTSSKLYYRYWFRIGSNFNSATGALTKHLYFDSNVIHGSLFPGHRISGTWGGNIYMVAQGGATIVDTGPPSYSNYKPQNVDTSSFVYLSTNTWYKVDGELYSGTPGNLDGWYKIWINDKLTHSYTGFNFLSSGDSAGWTKTELTPVWGASTSITSPAGGMDLYFDALTISNEPIGGGGTTDTTAPYLHTFSPADGATGVDNDTTSFTFHVADSGDGVDSDTISVSCTGESTSVSTSGTSADYTVTVSGLTLDFEQALSCSIGASDTAGNAMSTYTYNFTVEDDPGVALSLDECTLPSATVGTAYSGGTVTTTGGTSPYAYDTSAGTVATGLSISATTGLPVGTPTTAGTYNWTLRVTDAASATDTKACTLIVNSNVPGGQVTTTSFTLADTYVNGGAYADTNFSDNTQNRLYQWPLGTVANRTLVQVASLGLPDNISITSATLYMYLSTWDGSGGTTPMNAYVYPVTGQSWTIANVTWNTLDNSAVGAYESVTQVPLTAGWYSWTVTEAVQAAYAGASALTLLIDGGGDGAADTNRYFVSMDGAEAQRPYLSVTYTLLTPDGVPVSAPGRFRVSKLRGAIR